MVMNVGSVIFPSRNDPRVHVCTEVLGDGRYEFTRARRDRRTYQGTDAGSVTIVELHQGYATGDALDSLLDTLAGHERFLVEARDLHVRRRYSGGVSDSGLFLWTQSGHEGTQYVVRGKVVQARRYGTDVLRKVWEGTQRPDGVMTRAAAQGIDEKLRQHGLRSNATDVVGQNTLTMARSNLTFYVYAIRGGEPTYHGTIAAAKKELAQRYQRL